MKKKKTPSRFLTARKYEITGGAVVNHQPNVKYNADQKISKTSNDIICRRNLNLRKLLVPVTVKITLTDRHQADIVLKQFENICEQRISIEAENSAPHFVENETCNDTNMESFRCEEQHLTETNRTEQEQERNVKNEDDIYSEQEFLNSADYRKFEESVEEFLSPNYVLPIKYLGKRNLVCEHKEPIETHELQMVPMFSDESQKCDEKEPISITNTCSIVYKSNGEILRRYLEGELLCAGGNRYNSGFALSSWGTSSQKYPIYISRLASQNCSGNTSMFSTREKEAESVYTTKTVTGLFKKEELILSPSISMSVNKLSTVSHHESTHLGLTPSRFPVNSMLSHTKATLQQKTTLYRCNSCCNAFSSSSGLARHQKVMHGVKLHNFTCFVCGSHFKRNCDLEDHIDRRHYFKEYRCKLCHQVFRTKMDMATHVRRVHERRELCQCAACGKTFTRRPALLKHINSSCVIKQQQPPNPKQGQNETIVS